MTSREVFEARREAVAAAITQNPEQFDMLDWAHETACGWTYCIGGWAAVIAQKQGEVLPFRFPNGFAGIDEWASDWLGLESFATWRYRPLFAPDAPHQSPEDAALALKSAPYREA